MATNISGFPEFLPQEQIAFNRLIEIIKANFERYGFSPLDTPVVEKLSTLLAKGNDNEIYGLYRLAETEGPSKKELGLRFDLTVPLARYVAQHYGQLTFPYRRYHIAPVWRGERPQAGRYRQFYQCDIDVIGDGDLSLSYDAELLTIIRKIFIDIGIPRFTIKVNNRKVLGGLIKSFGIIEEDVPAVMRVIDKVDKISAAQFEAELAALHLSASAITLFKALPLEKRTNAEWLTYLKTLTDFKEFHEGVAELEQLLKDTEMLSGSTKHIMIDPSLARGLAYYTGTVYETRLDDCPDLGSICGGGRYANLTSSFINKSLPGVGISIGISRLVMKMIEMGWVKADTATTAPVLITMQDSNHIAQYAKLADMLRQAQVNTELYLQNKPLAAQMKYASKKGVQIAIISDGNELAQNKVNIRFLAQSTQVTVTTSEFVGVIVDWLQKNI